MKNIMKHIRRFVLLLEVAWCLLFGTKVINSFHNDDFIKLWFIFCYTLCALIIIEYKIRKYLKPDSPEVIAKKKKEWRDMLNERDKYIALTMPFIIILLIVMLIIMQYKLNN